MPQSKPLSLQLETRMQLVDQEFDERFGIHASQALIKRELKNRPDSIPSNASVFPEHYPKEMELYLG